MSDKWIKDNLIRPLLPEFTNGKIDQAGLVGKLLEDIAEYPTEYEEFTKNSRWIHGKNLVKSVINASRKSRQRRHSEEDVGGQTTMLDLPGWQEIEHDTVFIDGERIPTLNLSTLQLTTVIANWQKAIDEYQQAMQHYVALQQHLIVRKLDTVRDLYAA